MKRMPLYLITGFLGSGKTTFLKKILSQIKNSDLRDKKIGIIENEFGEVGIDGKLLEDEDIELTEIDNGSIFCSCRHDSFILALEELSDKNLDYIIIESSGISDPSSIKEDLQIIEEKIAPIYEYMGNITIIDSDAFLEAIEVFESIGRQIKHSNLIIINKVDMVSEDTIKKIEEKIQEIIKNPKHPVMKTTYCDFNFLELDAILLSSNSPAAEESVNKVSNQPQKIRLETKTRLKKEDLHHFLLHFAAKTFRIKGFVEMEEGVFYVDGVGQNIEFKEFVNLRLDDGLKAQLIIILNRGDPLGPIIREAWNDHYNT